MSRCPEWAMADMRIVDVRGGYHNTGLPDMLKYAVQAACCNPHGPGELSAIQYRTVEIEGVRHLCFYHHPVDGGLDFLFPHSAGKIAYVAHEWLRSATGSPASGAWPKQPDIDGSVEKGWWVMTELPESSGWDLQPFVAVAPCWIMFHK